MIDSLFKWSCSIDCQAHIFFIKTKNCSNDDIFISCDDRIRKMLHNICMSAVAMSLRWANRGPWASCFFLLFPLDFIQPSFLSEYTACVCNFYSLALIIMKFSRYILHALKICVCFWDYPSFIFHQLFLCLQLFYTQTLFVGGILFSRCPSVVSGSIRTYELTFRGQKIWTYCHLSSHLWVHMGFIL